MQLEFHAPHTAFPNPYTNPSAVGGMDASPFLEVKTYLVNKEGLKLFIESI